MSCTAGQRVRKTVANVLLVGMLVSMASCGPYRRSGGGGTSDLILRSEILRVPDRSAFSLIRLLRPRWLEARSQGTPRNPTPTYAHIYVDNIAYGPIDSLYDISTNMIDQINFIGSLDATTLYGTGFMGGVIHVRTRRGGWLQGPKGLVEAVDGVRVPRRGTERRKNLASGTISAPHCSLLARPPSPRSALLYQGGAATCPAWTPFPPR